MTARSAPPPGPVLTALTVVVSLAMLGPGGWAPRAAAAEREDGG